MMCSYCCSGFLLLLLCLSIGRSRFLTPHLTTHVSGYIRLKRTDPSTLDDPSTDCGMDVTPGDGVACSKDDSGNDIVPPATQICGTSGVLFDTSIPLGGHLL
jgi:hypothetical protein